MTKKSNTSITIIMADDHEIFRDGFRVMINKFPEIKILGEAENGEELVELADRLKPDVILTDIKMPKMDGIEVTRQLASRPKPFNIIALSMFDEENLIIDMLEAGAKGYLLKNAHKDEIIEAIRTVHKDKTYYCDHTSARLMQLIARSRLIPERQKEKPSFTERETDVIRLICEQLANKEIADRLHLSIRTIEGYREKIQEKMDVRNTAGIVVYAIREGIYAL
jgi:DNA-binding NarL/FixJ family response regulator